MTSVFYRSDGCPFCGKTGRSILQIRYSETAEANPVVDNVDGSISECQDCGVAFPNIGYNVSDFIALYTKTLGDLSYFDQTILQKMRRSFLALLMRAQMFDPLSAALQIPIHDRLPASLLDVGCGFGEFAEAYSKLDVKVAATEVLPQLVDLCVKKGIDCQLGALEDIKFGARRFDLILFRAVLYRTQNPRISLMRAKSLLSSTGAISVLDPCVDRPGIEYFARRQFPQGRYYIQDVGAFGRMLEREFGLQIVASRQIYGRPYAPMKKVRFWRNIFGLGELLLNNIFKRKPYMLAYLLRPTGALASS